MPFHKSIDSAPPSCFGIGYPARAMFLCFLCTHPEIFVSGYVKSMVTVLKVFHFFPQKNSGEDSHFDYVLHGLKRSTRNDVLEGGKLSHL